MSAAQHLCCLLCRQRNPPCVCRRFCLTLHRYEKYAAEKPEAAAKSKDPFNNAYTEVLERINELTLVQRCAAN